MKQFRGKFGIMCKELETITTVLPNPSKVLNKIISYTNTHICNLFLG